MQADTKHIPKKPVIMWLVTIFFTNLSFAKFLLLKKTTLVGSVRGNAKFLSQEHHAKLPISNCEFFINETKKIMTVRYQCKKKKKVIILSSPKFKC